MVVTSGGTDTLIAGHDSDIQNSDQADAELTRRFDGDVRSYLVRVPQALCTDIIDNAGQAAVFVIVRFPDSAGSYMFSWSFPKRLGGSRYILSR